MHPPQHREDSRLQGACVVISFKGLSLQSCQPAGGVKHSVSSLGASRSKDSKMLTQPRPGRPPCRRRYSTLPVGACRLRSGGSSTAPRGPAGLRVQRPAQLRSCPQPQHPCRARRDAAPNRGNRSPPPLRGWEAWHWGRRRWRHAPSGPALRA